MAEIISKLEFMVGSLYFDRRILTLTSNEEKRNLILKNLLIEGENHFTGRTTKGFYEQYKITNTSYKISDKYVYTLKRLNNERIAISFNKKIYVIAIVAYETDYKSVTVRNGKTTSYTEKGPVYKLTLVEQDILIDSIKVKKFPLTYK